MRISVPALGMFEVKLFVDGFVVKSLKFGNTVGETM